MVSQFCLLYVIALVNLVLGFAAAVYLGWGPRDWTFLSQFGQAVSRACKRRPPESKSPAAGGATASRTR